MWELGVIQCDLDRPPVYITTLTPHRIDDYHLPPKPTERAGVGPDAAGGDGLCLGLLDQAPLPHAVRSLFICGFVRVSVYVRTTDQPVDRT